MAIYELRMITEDGEIFDVLAEGEEAERVGAWLEAQGGAWERGQRYYAAPLASLRRDLATAVAADIRPTYINEADVVRGVIRVDLDKAQREVASERAISDLFAKAEK